LLGFAIFQTVKQNVHFLPESPPGVSRVCSIFLGFLSLTRVNDVAMLVPDCRNQGLSSPFRKIRRFGRSTGEKDKQSGRDKSCPVRNDSCEAIRRERLEPRKEETLSVSESTPSAKPTILGTRKDFGTCLAGKGTGVSALY
jgi:hypothetical protein